MVHYLLPENIGQALVAYLHQRPFGEVRKLIEALESLVEHKPEDQKPE